MIGDEIIRMAQEAGLGKLLQGDGLPTMWHGRNLGEIEYFAALVAAAERERICKDIKEEDDYCVDSGDYMLDSNDCISIVNNTWVRPIFNGEDIPARVKQ
mgnify:CR=1 FL=1